MLSVVCGISYLFKKLTRGHDVEDRTEHFPVHAAVHTDIKFDLKQPNSDALNLSSNASKGDIPDTQIVEELITQVDAIRVESAARSEAFERNTDNDRVDASDEVIGACSTEFTNAEDSIHGYLTCPFFSDPKTISFIRQSTTMFIMRGLPGSGKSTIVRFLRHLYPNSVVCSADDYFQQANGEYEFKWAKLPSTTVKWPVQVVAQREDGLSVYVKLDNSVFDQSKLSQAHAECQDKATTQCEADRPVVIIDNTNIMRWEMGFYLRLAQNERFYHTFIVEPQTPWRHNVVELAKRNKHGVDEDVLYKKLQSLQKSDVFPLYYGWFLTKKDGMELLNTSKEMLKACVKETNNSTETDCTKLKDILEDFDICYIDPKGMSHCTSKFVGSNFGHAYHHSNKVKDSMGKVFTLKVTGLVYTENSISARVNLKHSTCDVASACDIYEKDEELVLRNKYSDTAKKGRIPEYFYHGCSAHITLRYWERLQPKVAGDDILKICESGFHGKVNQIEVSHGKVHVYPENMFYFELKSPLEFDTLFHGYYSPARR